MNSSLTPKDALDSNITQLPSKTTNLYLLFHSSLKPWNGLSTTNCPPIFHKMISLTPISQASGLTVLLTVSPSVPPEPCPTHPSSFSSTAAIDAVNHQILLSTLAEPGIADSALTWFTSYLTNRTFQVIWDGSLSKPCFLETGVPQGSVIGPLLFSWYAGSLLSSITSHGFSYCCCADDIQMFLSFPHPPMPSIKLSSSWPDPADLSSTTAIGAGLSSQRMQRNSWSKCWSSPAWIATTTSWLDSQPLWLNHCSVSTTLRRALFSIYPNSPLWPPPPSSMISIGFLWQPTSNSRQWNLMAIKGTARIYLQALVRPPVQEQALPPLYQLASLYCHQWEQTKVA